MERNKETAWRFRRAEEKDRDFWYSLDRHLSPAGFDEKVRSGSAYILEADGEAAAVLRFFKFWDSIPFCSMLYVRKDMRGKGWGAAMLAAWEEEMKREGHDLVLTSTQADEGAQHFYRKQGYTDCGSFFLPFPGYEQPMELMLAKKLD